MEALRDSDSKIFQMLATRHSLITAADEKADTTTETRRKRAVGGIDDVDEEIGKLEAYNDAILVYESYHHLFISRV